MDNPPSSARMPDAGTSKPAKGTPCDAAYAIVWVEKCFTGKSKNMSENKTRPVS